MPASDHVAGFAALLDTSGVALTWLRVSPASNVNFTALLERVPDAPEKWDLEGSDQEHFLISCATAALPTSPKRGEVFQSSTHLFTVLGARHPLSRPIYRWLCAASLR